MATSSFLRSKEVSTMIKQGFINPNPSSPSRPKPHSQTQPIRSSPNGISPSPYPSPTLFEMMAQEPQTQIVQAQEKVSRIIAEAPFKGSSWRYGEGDVRLSVVAKDGYRVCMNVHKGVLVEKSGFFKERLLSCGEGEDVSVEIWECDDVEVYLETVVLMYWDEEELKVKVGNEGIEKVLGLLKVSAAIKFDTGIISCLEYLEAVPWSEDEEDKILSVLGELRLPDYVPDILERVSAEPSTSDRTNGIFLTLLSGVLEAKDDKSRREMKILISGLLREEATRSNNQHHRNCRVEVSKETLHHLCHKCLNSLVQCLSNASIMDENKKDKGMLQCEVAREADNMHWIVDIMINKNMGDEFVKLWADQKEFAILHLKIPKMYRYEVSRITAQLCIAIGRGQVLVTRDVRFSLLQTWLEALYEDFGWMRRACRSLDKKLVEDGLSKTILTLSLTQQQTLLLQWFDRFLDKGDDCPNIQRAFEMWWRRAFIRQYVPEQNSRLQITVCDYPT